MITEGQTLLNFSKHTKIVSDIKNALYPSTFNVLPNPGFL